MNLKSQNADSISTVVPGSNGCFALLLLICCAAISGSKAQENPTETAIDRTGTLYLSPSHTSDSWPKPGESGVLSPNYSATITVDVASGGKDEHGTKYTLVGAAKVTTECSDTNTIWTPDKGGVGSYSLTNTALNATDASLSVSCDWAPDSGGGKKGGGSSLLHGSGTATLQLTDSVVRWKTLLKAAWADGVRQIPFQGVFVDDQGFGLERNVIKVIKETQAEPRNPGWVVDFSQSSWHFTGNVRSSTPSKGKLNIGYFDGNKDGSNESDICEDELWFVKLAPGCLSFQGSKNKELYTDAGLEYSAPQWQRAGWDPKNAKQRNYPVAYVSGGTTGNIQIDSEWSIKPKDCPVTITMKASSDNIGDFTEVESTTTETQDVRKFSTNNAKSPLPHKIQYWEGEAIKWEGKLEGDTAFKELATTNTKFYVLLDSPGTKLYETFPYIGCKNAAGETTPLGAFAKIWTRIKNRSVQNMAGSTLCFWGAEDGYDDVSSAVTLIRTAHANCIAWADFMKFCLQAQGISGAELLHIEPKHISVSSGSASGWQMLIQWKFGSSSTAPPGASPFTYRLNSPEVVPELRLASQGNVPSPKNFRDHYVVNYAGSYYDPSYGLGPFSDPNSYENAVLVS